MLGRRALGVLFTGFLAFPAVAQPAPAPAPSVAPPAPVGPPPPVESSVPPAPGAQPAPVLPEQAGGTTALEPAAPPPQSGPPPNWQYVAPAYYPPPPPAQKPTERRHDGFYLRLGLGPGYGTVKSEGSIGSASFGDTFDFNARYKGLGPSYLLLIGGTVGHAWVLGGGFSGQDISDPQFSFSGDLSVRENTTLDGSLGIVVVAPFVDWYPNELRGLHFGAMLGLGFVGLRNDANDVSSGIGGSLAGGYDFWIAKQWSLGVEGRAVGVASKRTFAEELDGEIRDTASSFEILASGLFH